MGVRGLGRRTAGKRIPPTGSELGDIIVVELESTTGIIAPHHGER